VCLVPAGHCYEENTGEQKYDPTDKEKRSFRPSDLFAVSTPKRSPAGGDRDAATIAARSRLTPT
jgi:hypothetical protein